MKTSFRWWFILRRYLARLPAAIGLCALAWLVAAALPVAADTGSPELRYLPENDPQAPQATTGGICRFGVGTPNGISGYDVNSLRVGWYVDWGANASPPRPGGIGYVPMIRLKQTAQGGYTYTPSGATLANAIAGNPGAVWLIGNEPDRRVFQDDIEPKVYAQAYHDLYHLIRAQDPSAQIGAGGIVQPTLLRRRYLDLVLNSYWDRFHTKMPVDVWNIHAFILNERSCAYFPDDCWGAEVPPGMDDPQGMAIGLDQNADLGIFKQFVIEFRQWMAERGYQEQALYITEFGVQMPPDFGFTAQVVNKYMNDTFDFLTTTTGSTGQPADGYRLVQRWAWYSLTDSNFNGWLFDKTTHTRTVFGNNFATYTSRITPDVNLSPTRLWATTSRLPGSGQTASITLHARVANNGNAATGGTIAVRFYNGNPAAGGQLIGAGANIVGLNGCGTTADVAATWQSPPLGPHQVYVVVDATGAVGETNEADNSRSMAVLAGRFASLLPLSFNSFHYH